MRLTIILVDGFTALDIVGGYEVLANVPAIQVEFAAKQRGPVWADTRRLALSAFKSFEEIETTDILYVPGGPGVGPALEDDEVIETIRRLAMTSTWTVGICNGVELLGKAGLLGGKEVTTNWAVREKVATYGATVKHVRYVRDGKLVTGAGVSASIDASLYLAGLIAGKEFAKTVQLGIEYYPDPPFGNGTPDDAPDFAKKMVRQFEAEGTERIRSLTAPV
ncbi:DJ-1/PfpI family protein [Caenimonas sedimenti]|uniref:DJ-1/PfpI family protein n=1 Tax=Caenimonas sedimenti TaxID=2596921 RepID=A0A562ZFB9_9BURK|nr:DJ-1/PfpI family protein [Caenimonas sedimenti]TWO66029.1 DJ-1/PfpI family protein [Caenimonas sedimenti]